MLRAGCSSTLHPGDPSAQPPPIRSDPTARHLFSRVKHPQDLWRQPDASRIDHLPPEVVRLINEMAMCAKWTARYTPWVTAVDAIFMWMLHMHGNLSLRAAVVSKVYTLVVTQVRELESSALTEVFKSGSPNMSLHKFREALNNRKHPQKTGRGKHPLEPFEGGTYLRRRARWRGRTGFVRAWEGKARLIAMQVGIDLQDCP